MNIRRPGGGWRLVAREELPNKSATFKSNQILGETRLVCHFHLSRHSNCLNADGADDADELLHFTCVPPRCGASSRFLPYSACNLARVISIFRFAYSRIRFVICCLVDLGESPT